MRICFVLYCYGGGFASFVDNLTSLLIKNGHQVSFLILDNETTVPDSLSVKKRFFDLKTNSEYKNHKKPRKIRTLIERFVFHFKQGTREDLLKHKLFQNQLSAEWIVKWCKVKLNLNDFDCVVSAEEGISNYFLANNVIAKRKIGYVHPDYLMAHFNKNIDRKYFRKLDCVCGVSESNAESLRKAFPLLKKRIFGVRNPLDVEKVLYKSKKEIINFNKDQFNIVTVCRLDNVSKALDRLLNLASKLKFNGFDFNWRIIGDGAYKKDMVDFIESHNLQNNVTLLGHIDNPLPYVVASDLFVLQSYYEGYPMSVCESLIVKTPVLVSNFPSSIELVVNGLNGIIAKNDFDSIYEELSFLCKNKSVVAEMKNKLTKESNRKFEDIGPFLKVCSYDK